MTAISHVRLALPGPQEVDRWLAGPIPAWLSVEADPVQRIAWWATDDAAGEGAADLPLGLRPRRHSLGSAPVPGVVLATVDLDRAAADLADSVGSAWTDAGGDDLLGARCRRLTLDGSILVLAEPSTEGYAAACLARFGEGPIAVALNATPPDAARGAGRLAATNPIHGRPATYLRLGPRTAPTLIWLDAA